MRDDLQWDLGGQGQELLAVAPGVGGDAGEGPLLEQVALVVEAGDVAEVDPGYGERATSIQGRQPGGDQGAHGREEDGRVKRIRGPLGGIAGPGGAEVSGQPASFV